MSEISLEELKAENKKLKAQILDLLQKEEENIYKTFFNESPDIVIMVDSSYRYQQIHIPDVPRKNLDALIGRDLISTTPEKLRTEMLQALIKVFENKQTVVYESEGDSMGSYKYYLNYLAPIFDKEKNVKSAYIVSRDITLQKKSEKEAGHLEKKLNILFESIKHIYAIFDPDRNVIWFNEHANNSAKYMFNTELKIGMNASELFTPDKFNRFCNQFEQAKNGETINYTSSYLITNEQKIYLDVILQPIYDNNKLVAVANLAVDITVLIEKEEHSKNINKELILQNQQLYQYSHIISHNLRGPISTLMGIVNVIEEFKEDKDLINKLLGQVKNTAQKLDTIIQDLNTILNQTDKKTSVRQPLILAELIENIKELMDISNNPDIDLQYDLSEVNEIYSIKGYMHSILYNLISNAIKYKKIEEPAVIRIHTKKTDSNTIYIEVSDKGLGIDLAQYSSKLFGFYKRFHSHIDGKGIGLHITKTQVEIMGGKISVESQLNVGSVFKIYLPIAD
jgi:signal transduction histidine kinase